MSGLIGKKNSTLIKKKVTESALLATGVSSLRFWHEASDGDTIIPFGSLNLPGDISSNGFSNPSFSEISNANLGALSKNVEVVSSLNGRLMQALTYKVTNNQIRFLNSYTATQGEIFEITFKNDTVTGQTVIDTRNIVATGVLSSGNDEFLVGEAFRINVNPNDQIGDVMVFMDGVIQFRNVGNATAAPAADGNYQEIVATTGFANIIKFNDVVGYDRNVIVVSTNAIAERPTVSQLQYIESLASQLDSIIPTVATLAGVDESEFQATPNEVDLKAFGNKVNAILSAEVIINTPWTSFTPTGSWNVSTTYTGFYRRIGESIEVKIQIEAAADGNTGVLDVDMPLNLDLDTTKINIASNVAIIGYGQLLNNGVSRYTLETRYNDSVNKIRVASLDSTGSDAQGTDVTDSAPINFSSGDIIEFTATYPVQDWEATQTIKEQLGL